MTGGAGTAVYSCGVTPMISATVPITMMAMAAAGHAKSQQASQGGEQALTKQVQQLEKARPAPG